MNLTINATNITEAINTTCPDCTCPVLASVYVNIIWLGLMVIVVLFVWMKLFEKPFKAGIVSGSITLILGIIGGAMGYIPSWVYVTMMIMLLAFTLYHGREYLGI